MYDCNGIRASELAAALAEMIELHGDCRVMIDAGDYPDDCVGVRYIDETRADGYYHADTFVVH